MFLDLKKALKNARASSFAIGAFNVFDLESAKAVASAAKNLDAPIIFQTTPSAIEYAGLSQLFNIIKNEIAEKNLVAAIHLDHAKDFNLVKECVDIGYGSVMIDGSALDFDLNIQLTKKVVSFAKEYDVNVEAELGEIGKEAGEKGEADERRTDPKRVAEFVEKTGLDALAISIGNKHGAPKGERIDLELLKEISKQTKLPLVLHGSSGLKESDINNAKKFGIAKFNIDTKLRRAFLETAEKNESESDPRDLLKKIMGAQQAIVEQYIRIFGTEGKYDKV